MSAAAFTIFIRPVISQITIGNNKVSFFSLKDRKFLLSDYKVDKTASRLRYS
jgi:hypothetical protein